MRAYNISWDTDGDKDLLATLPTTVTIPDGIAEEDVGDYLSELTGFCHFGFDLDMDDCGFWDEPEILQAVEAGNKKQCIYQEGDISASTMGKDTDYIAIVHNRSSHMVTISQPEENSFGAFFETFCVPENDWVGIEANLEGYMVVSALMAHNVSVS